MFFSDSISKQIRVDFWVGEYLQSITNTAVTLPNTE